MDPYNVPCPDCDQTFTCEFFMLSHRIFDHLAQPSAFIDLACGSN